MAWKQEQQSKTNVYRGKGSLTEIEVSGMYVAVGFLEVGWCTKAVSVGVRRHGKSPCFLRYASYEVKASSRIVYISVYTSINRIMECMM